MVELPSATLISSISAFENESRNVTPVNTVLHVQAQLEMRRWPADAA